MVVYLPTDRSEILNPIRDDAFVYQHQDVYLVHKQIILLYPSSVEFSLRIFVIECKFNGKWVPKNNIFGPHTY